MPLITRDSQKSFLDLELIGCRVRIEGESPRDLSELRSWFEASAVGGDRGGGEPDLTVHMDSGGSGENALGALFGGEPGPLEVHFAGSSVDLISAITHWVTSRALRFSCFHAGCVVLGGKACLLPGESRSGKSTLTAAMLQRGFSLLSDEVGAMSIATRRMVPYGRVLSLRNDVLALLGLCEDVGIPTGSGAHLVRAAEIEARVCNANVELGLIVFPSVSKERTPQLIPLRPSEAVMRLLENSFNQRNLGGQGLDLLLDTAYRVPAYRMIFSEPIVAASQLEHLMRERVVPDAVP